jgi:trehalose 6-phosphate synthase
MNGALLVNPYDLQGVGDAVQQALVLPRAERRERHQRMLTVLRQNDIHAWHTRAVASLRGDVVPPRTWGTVSGASEPVRSRSPLRPPS